MTDLSYAQLLDCIRRTQGAYHKLTVLAGPAGSGKTRLLRQVADERKFPTVNISLLLSQCLLGLTQRKRALRAEEMATDIIDRHAQSGLCLDNTELLFDSTLRLNPLMFLQDVSRNRLIVATWNGTLVDGGLRFGHAGHPDCFRQAPCGFPVISVAPDRLQLYLST